MIIEVPVHTVRVHNDAATRGQLVERVAREAPRDRAGLQRTVQKQHEIRAGLHLLRQDAGDAAIAAVVGQVEALDNHVLHTSDTVAT